MKLLFDQNLAEKYKSGSQKVRVMTESWVKNEIYCPSCGRSLLSYKNNKPVADFYCDYCREDFELKSKNGKFYKKVSAGAYSQMIKRINSSEKPNFFFLGYLSKILNVNSFFVVPKHFFIPEVIEKRPALTNAIRAGWVGSNILLNKIPKAGQIYYIEDGKEYPKSVVLEKWKKTVFLKNINKVEAKGWILDIMNCIDLIDQKEFSLNDVYKYDKDLALIHPENKNIRPKIRQQLQFLRDKGYLEFLGNGKYRLS